MVQKVWLNRSRLNPQSSTSIVIDPVPRISKIKSQESLVSIQNIGVDTQSLESRYLTLQNMYKQLLTKAQGQKSIVESQNQQMEKLKIVHESNQNEIMRLRGMLGFLDKPQKQTQRFTSHHKKQASLFCSSSNVRSSLHIQKYSNHSIKEPKKNQESPKDTTLKSTNPSNSGSSWVSGCTKEKVFDMKDRTEQDFEEIRPSKYAISSNLKNKYKFVSSLAQA